MREEQRKNGRKTSKGRRTIEERKKSGSKVDKQEVKEELTEGRNRGRHGHK